MSMVQGTQSGTPATDLSALLQLAATQQGSSNTLDVKDLEESLNALRSFLAASGDSLLPDLEAPASKSNATVSLSALTMSGLSLETLLDAVGFEQRRTETKAGVASLEARAQERAMANEEKLKSIQEQLEKAKSQSFLNGLLKAFMQNIGKALSRDELLEMVWGHHYVGELKIVDVNIRRLRIKIEDSPADPTHIVTVRGYGYMWEG